jgi:hypothetical protein
MRSPSHARRSESNSSARVARPAGKRFRSAGPAWQSGVVTDADQTDWLTIPDLVERLGQTPSRIRRLIDDRHLLAMKIDGVLKVPAAFLRDDAPLPELHGTAMVLADAGFTDAQALEWLLGEEDSLGTTPIAALRAGRKSEVRRVAQALA